MLLEEDHIMRQNTYPKTANALVIVNRLVDSLKARTVGAVWIVPNCQETPKGLLEFLCSSGVCYAQSLYDTSRSSFVV